jgi:glycosidase
LVFTLHFLEALPIFIHLSVDFSWRVFLGFLEYSSTRRETVQPMRGCVVMPSNGKGSQSMSSLMRPPPVALRASLFLAGALFFLAQLQPLLAASGSQPRSSLASVPAWARDAVWYQIFPERFRNGDPSNDPTVNDILGTWPFEVPAEWHVSSWTADWYALQPWELGDAKGFYYRVQQRRYGGDLQGVIDKLGYLQDLGINAIYFNPLFESPSLHKYGAAMYHHIDKNFGPDPLGDLGIRATENPGDPSTWQWTSADTLFLSLIRQAHHRGMKVIIDGVFNHVGRTFWALNDIRANGDRSPYKDWFTVTRRDDPSTPEDEFEARGWMGVRDLPEFRKDSSGLGAGPRDHVHAIVRRWMDPDGDGDPADGIDGWRLDVAEMVPLPFWREFRKWVRAINPEAYITGEVWWEDWNNNKMFNAAPWLKGDAFDAVMNYRVAREACHFFKDSTKRIDAREFDRRLREIRGDYRPEATPVLMNLLDSHDTDRLGSMIVNVDVDFDKHAGASDNPAYKVRKPNASELRIQKLMVLFQMTYIGAPMVYYGDEAGMWGGDDPDERKPMLWNDMVYQPESAHPRGFARRADPNEVNEDLLASYKAAIALRTSLPALTRGDFRTVRAGRDGVIAYTRSTKGSTAIVVLNASEREASIQLPAPPRRSGSWEKRLSFGEVSPINGSTRITLSGVSGVVYEARRR